MSTNLILRGIIIPIIYVGIGFASAIFYDKYKNELPVNDKIININKFEDINEMEKNDK